MHCWCPGCQQLTPVVENVANKLEGIVFYDVDVDSSLEFAQEQ
nr:thioredoxin family protein [Virgibacillus pantothenticus]